MLNQTKRSRWHKLLKRILKPMWPTAGSRRHQSGHRWWTKPKCIYNDPHYPIRLFVRPKSSRKAELHKYGCCTVKYCNCKCPTLKLFLTFQHLFFLTYFKQNRGSIILFGGKIYLWHYLGPNKQLKFGQYEYHFSDAEFRNMPTKIKGGNAIIVAESAMLLP